MSNFYFVFKVRTNRPDIIPDYYILNNRYIGYVGFDSGGLQNTLRPKLEHLAKIKNEYQLIATGYVKDDDELHKLNCESERMGSDKIEDIIKKYNLKTNTEKDWYTVYYPFKNSSISVLRSSSPSTPNRSPESMQNQKSKTKPTDAEQHADKGLDGTICSATFGTMQEAYLRIIAAPWKQATRGPNGCPIIGNAKGTMVCMLAHSAKHDDQKQEAEANAAIIESAPKMLKALLSAEAVMAAFEKNGHDISTDLYDVRAAISCALGISGSKVTCPECNGEGELECLHADFYTCPMCKGRKTILLPN